MQWGPSYLIADRDRSSVSKRGFQRRRLDFDGLGLENSSKSRRGRDSGAHIEAEVAGSPADTVGMYSNRLGVAAGSGFMICG